MLTCGCISITGAWNIHMRYWQRHLRQRTSSTCQHVQLCSAGLICGTFWSRYIEVCYINLVLLKWGSLPWSCMIDSSGKITWFCSKWVSCFMHSVDLELMIVCWIYARWSVTFCSLLSRLKITFGKKFLMNVGLSSHQVSYISTVPLSS